VYRVLELEAMCYGYRSGMAFGLLTKIKNQIECWCCPGSRMCALHDVALDTHSTNYWIMNDDQDRPSSAKRVEEWVMDTDNSMDMIMRRTSMLKNVMCNDDILIVMCPKCLMARVAACTKEDLEKFAELITNEDEKAMTGLVVASYCDVGMDRCSNIDESVDMKEHKLISEFKDVPSSMTISDIVDQITYMRSDSDRDEIMFFTSEELVDVCRTMHRVPLKFKDWDIIMPTTEDRWTKMDWIRDTFRTGARGRTGTG
jgi:hypothetical protein